MAATELYHLILTNILNMSHIRKGGLEKSVLFETSLAHLNTCFCPLRKTALTRRYGFREQCVVKV